MSFEVRHNDLLGRIGYLRTKSGTVETPLLLPVVNPNSQLIAPQQLRDTFSFDAVITNSYLIWKRYRESRDVPRIHELLNFNGVIATDSGAYQILQYGDVEVQPNEIVKFQEKLESDIAVILDVPTGAELSRDRARWTVEETLRRADRSLKLIVRDDILWVGPIQGGIYADLVSFSAKEMAKRDFSIYALGSPTPVMQQYRFETLVEMVMAAKVQLPLGKPLHLFGAGHPMMFAFAVAMGCDIFDSASYALFARSGRYMTVQGTAKIDELAYFPCSCPVCQSTTPEKVNRMLLMDRERHLAMHNLYACFEEIQTIKQAILDGRLWELAEARSRNHPAIQTAFHAMLRYKKEFEANTPVRKRKGPFILTEQSLSRPEVIRHQTRLLERYSPPPKTKSLLLLPEELTKSFRAQADPDAGLAILERLAGVHICLYSLDYGIIPQELTDVYPLSQTETSLEPSSRAVSFARKRAVEYLRRFSYSRCMIIGYEPWHERFFKSLKRSCKRRIRVHYRIEGELNRIAARRIARALKSPH